jgi:Pterin 4 alpha carbinolamine dehydratase
MRVLSANAGNRPVVAALSGWRLADLPLPPMPALADNRVHAEGGAMPRPDDIAVEEGLQHLPGWERRGNEIVKTFTREDFAQAMVFVNEVAVAAEAAGHHPTSTSAGTRSPWPSPAMPRVA